MPLPPELNDAGKLLKRFEHAKKRRNSSLWSHLQECYEYAAPQRETFQQHVEGSKKNTDLFDDSAITDLQIFANRMQKAVCPPWQEWSVPVPGDDLTEEEKQQKVDFQGKQVSFEAALQGINEIAFGYIHRSNFSSRVYESFIDFGISTGGLTCHWDNDRDKLVFNAPPLSQLYLEAGPDGEVNTHWREHELEGASIKLLWPDASIDDVTARKIEKDPKHKVKVLEGSIYHEGNYWYVVILKAQKHIAFEQDEEETGPFISYRGMVVPGETYGRGPIMQLLPSIKTLNVIKEFELTGAAIASAGIWMGRDDGVFNPYTVRIAPGIVIPVGSNDTSNPTIAELPMNFKMDFTQISAEQIENRIHRTLFAQPLGDMDDPTKTLGELQMRLQLDMEDSGAFFARVHVELVESVMKRVYHVLRREGKIPNISIDGKVVKLKHQSPIARVMDQNDLQNLDAAMARVAALGPQAMHMTFHMDKVGAYIAKKQGVDASLILDDKERKKLQDDIKQAATAVAENTEGGAETVVNAATEAAGGQV